MMRSALSIALPVIAGLFVGCARHFVAWSSGPLDDSITEIVIESTDNVHVLDELVLLIQAEDDPERIEVSDTPTARVRAISPSDGREVWSIRAPLDVGWGIELYPLGNHDVVVSSGPELVRLDTRTGQIRWSSTHSDHTQQRWFVLGNKIIGTSGEDLITVRLSNGQESGRAALPVRGTLIGVERWGHQRTAVVADTLVRTTVYLVNASNPDQYESINLQATAEGATSVSGNLLLSAAGSLNGGSLLARLPRRGVRSVLPTPGSVPCWITSFGAVCGEMSARTTWNGSYPRERLQLARLEAFAAQNALDTPLWRTSVPTGYALGVLREAGTGHIFIVDDNWVHVLTSDTGEVVQSVARADGNAGFCYAYGVASGRLVEGCFEQDSPTLRLTPLNTSGP